MGEDQKDEFVCYPVSQGVGYVHPLDIVTVVDNGEGTALMVLRSTTDKPIEVFVACSAAEVHRRRMAAFKYVRDQMQAPRSPWGQDTRSA